MAFDIEMIKKVYKKYPKAIEDARRTTGKSLTLSEKILYAHLWNGNATQKFKRGTAIGGALSVAVGGVGGARWWL